MNLNPDVNYYRSYSSTELNNMIDKNRFPKEKFELKHVFSNEFQIFVKLIKNYSLCLLIFQDNIYKTNNFGVINKSSICGSTNDCLRIIKSCDKNYKRKFSVYSGCVNHAIFGRNFEFPDKEKYMKLMYSASNSKSSIAKNMRKVYFQIILSVLKSSGYNEEYESLYQDAMKSIIIDFQNLDFDLSKVQDKTYNEVAEIVYFSDLVNKYNHDTFERKKFYNKENSVTNGAFLNELNVKYFQNSIDTKYIKYILENLYNYNLEPILLSNPNINTTTISEFQKNFLVDYNEYYSINDMVDYMEEDVTSNYNIFEFIYEVCTILNKEFNIKYVYNENDKKMTSSLDFSSLYENVNTISELIYNLIFDYYNYIYAISVDKDFKDSYTVLHYFDEDDLYFTIKFGNTLDALMDSDFYKSIYYPIISFNKKNKGNKYISECVRLVEQLYKFTNGNYELKKIKKEKFTVKKDIDYKADIDEFYDIQFRENSFLNLIENKDTDIYKDELINYIHEYCLKYSKMGASYFHYALSALNLENQYSINDDNIIHMTYVLKKNEEEIYKAWYNQNLELIDDDKSSEYVVSEIMNIMKSNVAYSVIDEYLLDTYNNSTLRKLQNPEKYDQATQELIDIIVREKIESDGIIQIRINGNRTTNNMYYNAFKDNEKRYREEYKRIIDSTEKLYLSNSERENEFIKDGPELASFAMKALDEYVASSLVKNSSSPINKFYRAIKGSIKRKHFGLALKSLRHYDEFNKFNKWNKFNNRHELEFLNVMRNYNKGKSKEDKYTFVSEKGNSKFNIDATDDPVESYKKRKQYIEDLKVIYNKIAVKKQLGNSEEGTEWEREHPLSEFIGKLVVSSENEYCYSNTNIHEESMEDLNDIPEDLFEKPTNPNNQASDLEKKKAAECLLRAVKNINNFDHTKKLFSLTKLSRNDKDKGITELTNALRNEEGKLDEISDFIKTNAVNKTEKSKKQIKEIDEAIKKLSDTYKNAPLADNNSNNSSNNGENNGGNNGENDDDNAGNDNSNDRDEGHRTTKRTRKGKRSYPKTMFKRKF
ncbi:hypothetical protein H8356DRAFT_1385258 [Neocallimastix lanati (nom. inval.)]|nr:hypothetical protein H8356DRAFT_1385258 [Neocallimastix sp. JGI-2020a]